MDITPQIFREVMGSWATGLAVATAAAEDGRAGLTVNSFAAVSLEPPLVSFCLDRRTACFPLFLAADGFALNFLHEGQEGVVRAFAARGQDEARWQGLTVETGPCGNPLLTDCLARMDCLRTEIFEAGDHVILLGQVQFLEVRGGKPLVHYRRLYGGFQEKS